MPNSLHMDVHPNDVRGFGPSSNFHFCWLNRHVCRFKTAFDCQKAFLIPCRTLWFKPPSTALADSPPLRGQSSEDFKARDQRLICIAIFLSSFLSFSIIFYHVLSFSIIFSLSFYLASYLSKCISYVPRLSYSTAKYVVSLHCWHFPQT